MSMIAVLFWLAALCVAHAYFFYPLFMGLLAVWRPRPVSKTKGVPPPTTVLLAVFNEERTIGRRVEEFAELLTCAGVPGEILVVSDGSTDRTAEISRKLADTLSRSKLTIRSIELPSNQGKAVALTEGGKVATGEVIVLADARQTWAPDALGELLANFSDPSVGAVSGELMIESSPGVLAGVGIYWQFEKWLRQRESRVYSMVGVTGAICAVRRELFEPIPRGTILDDVYWPLAVAIRGKRVVFDGQARAYDRLPALLADEFRRKVRTLAGNYQLLNRLPGLLNPFRNPIWLQFVSHKLLRLIVPWALLFMPVACLILGGPLYSTLLGLQVLGYGLAIGGLIPQVSVRSRLMSAAASFLVLNVAAWMAFWVWASGQTSRSWRKAAYQASELGLESNSPVDAD